MATYLELRNFFADADMLNKTEVAIAVAAHSLLAGVPTADEINWAAAALERPKAEAKKALIFVLAANIGLNAAQIQVASDAAIQAQVDLVVPSLVTALNAKGV